MCMLWEKYIEDLIWLPTLAHGAQSCNAPLLVCRKHQHDITKRIAQEITKSNTKVWWGRGGNCNYVFRCFMNFLLYLYHKIIKLHYMKRTWPGTRHLQLVTKYKKQQFRTAGAIMSIRMSVLITCNHLQ